MIFSQEIKILAGFKLITLPAAINSFPLTTLSHLTEGRATATPAGILAAKFYHCPQDLIALRVVLECLEEWDIGERFRRLLELCLS